MLTEPEQRIKIIITDDHRLFRTGVRNGLANKRGIEIIGEAENGQDLLQKLEYLKPDIIILNIQMPVMDGLTTLPILKKRYPAIKVIILSMHSDPSVICRMIELGANTYLTKDAGSDEIYETILVCHKNWFFINHTVRNAIINKKIERQTGSAHTFTEKEIRILKLLYKGEKTKEIGVEVDLSYRTVEAIIDKLKTKTGCKSIEALIEFAVKNKIIE